MGDRVIPEGLRLINKIATYTSTGSKIMFHPGVIKRIQTENKGTLVTLQIAPESRCNLSCSFCSNAKRDKHETLEISRIADLLLKLIPQGLKCIEISGGGEPALYPHINDLIEFAYNQGLKIGLISNGILLKKNIHQDNLDRLSWLRVSMNCLDYVNEVNLPTIKETLGFSYVMNEKTNGDVLLKLDDYVDRYKPAYIRVVPNCRATNKEQEINNTNYGELIAKWESPYFYQPKTFGKPNNCFWCYFKPFLLHDGFVYPCSSVVLNDTADVQFHDRFRWCAMEELLKKYDLPMESFNNIECNKCVFKQQNDIIESILNPNNMEEFI